MRSEVEIRQRLRNLKNEKKRFPRLGYITIQIVLLEWILGIQEDDTE